MTLLDNVRTAVGQSRPKWGTSQIAVDSERYLRSFGLWDHRRRSRHRCREA